MNLDEGQKNAILSQFRERVRDLNQDDKNLHRFLQARNYDVKSAELMLRNSLEWRREHDMDTALHWDIAPIIPERFPMEYPGVDYENRAVIYIPLGSWPITEMIEGGFKEEMYRNIYKTMERIIYETEKTGEQYTLIGDMAESSYWKFAHYETVQMILSVFRDTEANYPERLAEAWILNMPMFLNYAYNCLAKPLLSGKTLSKATFLGSNPETFMPVLLERIPKSSMPTRLKKYLK